MLRTCSVCCNKGKVDVRGCNTGKLDLSLFSCFLKSLESHLITTEVNAAVFTHKCFSDPVNDSLVEVVTAQLVVTCCSKNLKYAVIGNFKNGYVKCTAAKVVDHNLLVLILICAVCKSCCCRLVDNTENLKTCDLTCILCSLTLSVGEVCGNCDNCLIYRAAKVCFSIALKLLKDHCGNFLRSIIFAVDSYLICGAHLTLDAHNCSVGVCNTLTLSYLTNHSFAVLRESNNGRCCSCAFGIGNYYRLAAFKYCYAGVCCT